jgi:hypothetical protein
MRKVYPREDRKQRLDKLGFRWSFEEQYFKQWKEQYKQLKSLKETNRNLILPADNKSLQDWVTRQLVQFANGRMNRERKALLEEIGFRSEILQ